MDFEIGKIYNVSFLKTFWKLNRKDFSYRYDMGFEHNFYFGKFVKIDENSYILEETFLINNYENYDKNLFDILNKDLFEDKNYIIIDAQICY